MANPNKDSVDLAKDEALRQRKGGQAKQMFKGLLHTLPGGLHLHDFLFLLGGQVVDVFDGGVRGVLHLLFGLDPVVLGLFEHGGGHALGACAPDFLVGEDRVDIGGGERGGFEHGRAADDGNQAHKPQPAEAGGGDGNPATGTGRPRIVLRRLAEGAADG